MTTQSIKTTLRSLTTHCQTLQITRFSLWKENFTDDTQRRDLGLQSAIILTTG